MHSCFHGRRVAPLSSECATQFPESTLFKLTNWVPLTWRTEGLHSKQQTKYQVLHAEQDGLKYFSLIRSLDSWELSGFPCVDFVFFQGVVFWRESAFCGPESEPFLSINGINGDSPEVQQATINCRSVYTSWSEEWWRWADGTGQQATGWRRPGIFFRCNGSQRLGGEPTTRSSAFGSFPKKNPEVCGSDPPASREHLFFLKFLGGSDLFLMSKLRGTDFLPFATFDAQLVSSSFDPEVASRTSSTTWGFFASIPTTTSCISCNAKKEDFKL